MSVRTRYVTFARFGPSNGSPADADLPVVPVPADRRCDYFRCGEPFLEHERGYVFPVAGLDPDTPPQTYAVHHDCYLFSIGAIEIDGTERTTCHTPNSPECMCDAWRHGVRPV